jgi:hypothetical protein
MHFIRKEFLTFNDTLYYIMRIIKEEDQPIVDNWKEYLQADIVLKKQNLFYFLRSVPDLEIIP